MTEQLSIGLIGTLAGSVAANGHQLLPSRNPVIGAVLRLLRWYTPKATSYVAKRVSRALGRAAEKLGTALVAVHPLGRLVPGSLVDVAWPLTASPLSTAYSLGVRDRNVAYTTGRLLSHFSGSSAFTLVVADLAYGLGTHTSWLYKLFARVARFVSATLKVGSLAAVLLALCLVLRWWQMRGWRVSVFHGAAAPMLHNGMQVAREDVELDDQVDVANDEENEELGITEQEIPRRNTAQFIRRCALWCKANFTCTPGRLSEAQFIVVRESLARELRKRNVRNAHIANVLDMAVHLAFVPTDVELEGAKLMNSDLFKARRTETAVARTSWWSFAINKVWFILGHQGAVQLVA